MTTEILEDKDPWGKETSYDKWVKSEGIPVIGGYSVEDLNTIKLGPWNRKGGLGAFVRMEGAEETNDCYVSEIPPGSNQKPQRHMFEELIYVLKGRGATSVWVDGGKPQTFEWQEGSLFSPPMNVWHQHFNGQGNAPARYLAVTSAPMVINLFHNTEFVFDNPFVFKDRFNSETDYFGTKGTLHRGVEHFWESNFIPDMRRFQLYPYGVRGAGGSNCKFMLSENTMVAHVSEFPVGTYKKGHRHGPGAHVVLIGGTGYSLMWLEGQPKMKIDWHEGSMFVPPDKWFHQHFNTGAEPAKYLALRWGSKKYKMGKEFGTREDIKKGGDQIEYQDEDPEIRALFDSELAKKGLKANMPPVGNKK
ncbi:MAG: cupin domain-containing protein [Dehalococcoidia bacterium]|nr:cupin domain-containing protein [Dehalococcoidia bacterium]MDZ4246669.1 cupin domain-containing protein [Dehalococcoidia bacterium]